MKNSEILCAVRSRLGETPIWDADGRRIIYTDLYSSTVRTVDWDTLRTTEVTYPQRPGAIALTANGKLIGAMEDGIYLLHPDGTMQLLHEPFALEGVAFGDGKVGPDGRFYAGMKDPQGGQGAFYCLDKDLTLRKLFDGVGISNGLAWDKAGTTLYYVDSAKYRIDAFDFDGVRGTLSNRRTVFDIPVRGLGIDGMCIDENDELWCATWSNRCLLHVDPACGKIIKTVEVPEEKITCCAFVGPQLDCLAVTTGAEAIDVARYPNSGKLLGLDVGVGGFAMAKFDAVL